MPEPKALLEMTADIITAMVAHNRVGTEQLPDLIGSVHTALAGLGQPAEVKEDIALPEPAVSVRKSLADPDVIISMIDGKPYKTLTRHLGVHGYTADTYRTAFGLKADYPMVAPSYAAKRSALAKTLGLGRKKKSETDAVSAPSEPELPLAANAEAAPEKRKKRRKINEPAS